MDTNTTCNIMKSLAKILLPMVLVSSATPSMAYTAYTNCCDGRFCAIGKSYCPDWFARQSPREQHKLMKNRIHLAQYYPPQYYPAQMMGGVGAPVVVPPTIVNTQGYEHNSSKKSCKESVVDLFLFSVRRTTGDCTP